MSDFSKDPRYQELQAVRKEIELLSDSSFVNAVVASLIVSGRITSKSSSDEIDQALGDVLLPLSMSHARVADAASRLLNQRKKDEQILKSYFPGVKI